MTDPSSASSSSSSTARDGARATQATPAPRARSLRTNGRVVVRITFTLPHRETVLLTLRGPAPSCRTAGTVRFSGVRGDNRLDFLGRIRSKALPPGVYVLTLTRASSRLPVAEPLLVQVVSPRRTILIDESPTPAAACDHRQPAAGTPEIGLVVAAFEPPASAGRRVTEPSTSLPPQRAGGSGGVLGVGLPALPEPAALPRQGSWALALLLLVAVLGVPLVALSALAVRFLRRRRLAEPS